jgi:hypothetical protein
MYTDETCNDTIGIFHVQDTVQFVLYDTLTYKMQIFDRIIKNGPNVFEFVWQPTKTVFTSVTASTRKVRTSTLLSTNNTGTHTVTTPTTTWALEQNYPNPFYATTILPFSLASHAYVTLTAKNYTTKQQTVLLQRYCLAGSYWVAFSP